MNKSFVTTVWVAVISAVCGYLAFYVPWKISGLGRTMIDGMQPVTFLFLLIIGFAGGIIIPRKFWLGGLCSVSLLPIIAIVEMFIDSTSHNLFPIEFFFYAVFGGIAILGGLIGKLFRPNKSKIE